MAYSNESLDALTEGYEPSFGEYAKLPECFSSSELFQDVADDDDWNGISDEEDSDATPTAAEQPSAEELQQFTDAARRQFAARATVATRAVYQVMALVDASFPCAGVDVLSEAITYVLTHECGWEVTRVSPTSRCQLRECHLLPRSWADNIIAYKAANGEECIIDFDFASKFTPGPSCQTPEYTSILAGVAPVFVGSVGHLSRTMDQLYVHMCNSYTETGMSLPPYRTLDALKHLYRTCQSLDGAPTRRHVRMLTAVVQHGTTDTRLEALARGLRALRQALVAPAPNADVVQLRRYLAQMPVPEPIREIKFEKSPVPAKKSPAKPATPATEKGGKERRAPGAAAPAPAAAVTPYQPSALATVLRQPRGTGKYAHVLPIGSRYRQFKRA